MSALIDASVPDLLRLLVVPVLGWAAWRDIETRRVPNRTWYPLAALAVVTLAWDAWAAFGGTAFETRAFLIRTAVSLFFVAPLVLGFWWFRAFGGADAKAFLVVAVLFPTFPTYAVSGVVLPVQHTAIGVFSFTILTNTVLVAALYPVALFGRNLAAGESARVMLFGKRVDWSDIPTQHGRLLETPDGYTRDGLDLDALRMYLRWRGVSLADLRARAGELRDPATLPADPGDPTDGAVPATATDGGVDPARKERADGDNRPDLDSDADPAPGSDGARGDYDDPWGAETFLEDIDHWAYGTDAETLREGLDLLAAEDDVWVSPGMPFIVPLFVGLVVALTFGDLLFAALSPLGVV